MDATIVANVAELDSLTSSLSLMVSLSNPAPRTKNHARYGCSSDRLYPVNHTLEEILFQIVPRATAIDHKKIRYIFQ